MTIIRRVLIALVAFALVLDAGAIVLIKAYAGPKPSEEMVKVVYKIDDKDQAEAVKEVFAEMEYPATLQPSSRIETVEANYRVVMTGEKRELLEPIARVLKKAGHTNLSFNEEGTKLFYGGVYEQKAAAQRKVKALEAKERLIFEVQPGQKKVKKPTFKVYVQEMPKNFEPILKSKIEEQLPDVSIAEENVEDVEPKDDAGANETAEEETSTEEE